MTFPAHTKTWTTSFNNAVTAAASATLTGQKVVQKFAALLQTAGWTIVSNCNASVVSGVNYGGLVGGSIGPCAGPAAHSGHFSTSTSTIDSWVIAGNTLTAAAGHISVATDMLGVAADRHPWKVLRNANLASGNYQLLIECVAGLTVNLYVSPSVGFTGGTVTARPTATDEVLLSSTIFNLSATNSQHQFHLWYSSDGKCTRIMTCKAGVINGFFCFDEPESPVSGWSNPTYALVSYVAAGSANTFAVLSSLTCMNMFGNLYGTSTPTRYFQGGTTFEAFATNSPLATTAGVGTVVNSFSSTWPVLPMGIGSNAAGNTGRLGGVFDMYHAPTGLADADTSNTGSVYVVKLGGVILPWDNATAVLLT